ncbi:LamG-like jellyroll fold domain-containing protein [Actinoplanes sp. NPDC051346]|uniref:LamG-like jellyroll fold domain-containing protein n=1 Tax=Actinoplanes sp. NPDC051346 TaxID=3155048 RepID=UPI003446118E
MPVGSLTDEYSTTSANPDGTLTRLSSSSPQRVKKNDEWVPVDTTLVRKSDGTYAPKAALTTLSVSDGGGTQLLSMKDGRNAIKLSWAKKLPPAKVAGDTATYPDVFPDVDLQVTADPTGYSSMLVVKTPEAAANPELKKVDFGLTGTNVRIDETSNGGAKAVDPKTGEQVFHTDTALMWDSTPAKDVAAVPASGDPTPQEMRVAGGRLGGNRAQIKVDISKGKQSLTLDQKLLTAKTTKYPVFVDPYWSGSPGKSQLKWARISSNGWDVYNSTSKTGHTSARIGYDNWPESGGGGERARTYYQMNTAGIKGAEIFEANLYVVHRWSAACNSKKAAVVYGTGGISSWSSSGLNWGKQPSKKTGVLSTAYGTEVDCGTSKPKPSPAGLQFNVVSFIKTAAKDKLSNATFMVEAKDMDDKYAWKQLGYGGGATLSVKYSYKPKFLNGTGNPTIKPSIVDQGRILTTTRTPTLTAQGYTPKANGYQENVQISYQVFNSAGTKVASGYGPSKGYNLNGSSWTVTPALADGNYKWKAAIKNASGVWGGVWSQEQAFTVDTVAPKAPGVRSTQFPPNQVGAALSDKGLFVLSNDRSNNITGYLFSLDGDLSNVVYGSNKGTPWTANTVIKPGIVYFAKADNGNGTGATVINGTAGVSFAPGTAGEHRVFAKAVDQAGSTSPQTAYVFNAGSSTPVYAYGDKMIEGWTATNADGTTVAVPPATHTSVNGFLRKQQHYPGYYFASGFQAMFSNVDANKKVANGETATFNFHVPKTGLWRLGANLTIGMDYGTYTLTLDKGKPTEKVLLENFDAYNARGANTTYRNFDGSEIELGQGVHSVTLKLTGKNAGSAGYQAGIDVLRLTRTPACTINDPADCFNNTAISTYTPGTAPTVTPADADGSGNSFEAADLKAAGWTAGGTVTVNGAAIKLPARFGDGTPDNMLASGQIVTVPDSGVVNKGNALVFVGFAAHGHPLNATGTINYSGSGCGMRSQTYTLSRVSDWDATTPAETFLSFTRTNHSGNKTQKPSRVSMFAFSVPLQCPGAPISSITLPLVTNTVVAGVTSLHFFGLGIRPTSITGKGADAKHWVGSWAAAQDTAAVPNDTSPTTRVDATLNNQTVRIPARLTIGTAGDNQQVRVRLANSLGKTPVTLDAATVALQSSAGGATAADTPIPLTFGGGRTLTLPVGADAISDPVDLTVPDRTTALVSLKVRGNLASLSGHQDYREPVFVSAADNVDRTGESAGTNFTRSTFMGAPFLSGIDVTTSTADPAGAVALFGDHTVNSDTAGEGGRSQVDGRLADGLAVTEDGEQRVPMGVLNLGSSSWGLRGQLPVGNAALPESAMATVDRAVLHQANVRTALISAGSSDLLACTAATAEACAAPVRTKLVALATQLRQYKTDDAPNSAITLPTKTGAIKVYAATLPPFHATHTAVQEAARQLVNGYILGAEGGQPLQGYADGVINFAAAVSTNGDHLSDTVLADYTWNDGGRLLPSDLYYQALADQYLLDADASDWSNDDQSGGTEPDAEAIAAWKFDEGAGETAKDTGFGTGSGRTTHDATLNNVGWGAGRMFGRKAGVFNGTSSYASTDLKLNTARSFTVSAWARLTDKSADRTIFARDAKGYASLYFQYQKSSDRWLAQMPSATTGDAVKWQGALSSSPAQTGVWTHLTAAYDADLKTLTLYVNGAAETSVDEMESFNDPEGATWIGRSGTTWFAGDIADVNVWARARNAAEIDEQASAAPIANWQLDDDSDPTIAKDATDAENHGKLAGGAGYTYPGHNDWDIAALKFNGTDAAVTAGPLVRTDQSFTVAAWAKISKTDGDYTVLSQDGAHASRFALQWGSSCSCWRFVSADTDQAVPATAHADGPTGAAANTWTHLAATYDATSGTMTLYVNGVAAEPVQTAAAPWQATGAFAAGRGRGNDRNSGWFPGEVDAVRLYQGVLSADAIMGLSQS